MTAESNGDVKIRQSARLIVLNEFDEILLFDCNESPREDRYAGITRFWITPGGGLDSGETWEDSARRELWEETGLRNIELGPWVWSRQKHRVHFGELTPGQEERYFLVRVSGAVISNANQFDYEREVYTDVRWWSVDAIRASSETFYPEGLADLLEPLIAGALPAEPVALRE